MARTVTGPFAEGFGVSATIKPSVEVGKGIVIGDNYVLTAGHVVFEWDRKSGSSPNIVTDHQYEGDVYDYRNYLLSYASQAILASIPHPTGGPIISNEQIEGKIGNKDTVLLSNQSVSVNGNSAGLVVFMNPADMTESNLKSSLDDSGASIERDAIGTRPGTIKYASGGTLKFSVFSKKGDSGGGYILNTKGRSYVIGTHTGNVGDDITLASGTYFTYQEWFGINSQINQNKSGDITGSDPKNLVVGSSDGDAIEGSYRADILLGRGGDDLLNSGDLETAAYADDTLDGGAGNDTLVGGQGFDSLIGGADADVFSVTDGDIIKDPEKIEKEIVLYKGDRLGGATRKGQSGGQPDDPPNGTYEADDGTTYEVSGGDLKITTADGDYIYIQNYQQGAAGIWLTEEPDTPTPESFASPLVLDLDGDGIEITPEVRSSAYFDFENDGFKEHTAWVNPDDAFLTWDRNDNGTIDNGSELFGANPDSLNLKLSSLGGFSKLAELDSDGDKQITSADEHFSDLRLWQDFDGDGLSDPSELSSLADNDIVSINLDYRWAPTNIADSKITEESLFTFTNDSKGVIADVWFKTDPAAALPAQQISVSAEVQNLPQIGSSGKVRDLQSAMQIDPRLREMVQALVDLEPEDAWRFGGMVEGILQRWTGADETPPDSRGQSIDARFVTVLEQWEGTNFRQSGFAEVVNPRPQASAALMRDYRDLFSTTAAKLLAQIPLGAELLPELSYQLDAFLTLDEGFSPTEFVDRLVGLSPSDGYQQIAFWAGAVKVAESLWDDAGADHEDLISAFDAVLPTINPAISYETLQRTIVGTSSNDLLTGRSTEINENYGDPNLSYWTNGDAGAIDWFLGGAGDDTLSGGYGRDTYIFGTGSGHDVVKSVDGWWLGDRDQSDVVQLMSGTSLSSIITSIVQEDGCTVARVAIDGTSDMLDFIIPNYRVDKYNNQIIRIVDAAGQFIDFDVQTGTVSEITSADSLEDVEFEKYGIDSLLVKSDSGIIYGLIPHYYSKVIESGTAINLGGNPISLSDVDQERLRRAKTSGDDQIEGTARDEIIDGLSGNDKISAGGGNDVIDGGAGSDVLQGDRGNDTYLFELGSGFDDIQDQFGLNKVILGENISISDLIFSFGPQGSDLIVRIDGTTDGFLVRDQFGPEGGGINLIEFADSSTLDREQILALMPEPGIQASSPILQLGTYGDDTIASSGGFGIANGNEGADTYVFNRGDGVLWISDDAYEYPSAVNALQFGPDISPDDIEIRWMPDAIVSDPYNPEHSLEISIKGTEDKVRIQSFLPYYRGGPASIGEIQFADNTVLTFDDILTALQQGTDGADVIYAWSENATIDGGAGDDFLSPGNGAASTDEVTFRFDVGSGHDTISSLRDWHDPKIEFGDAIDASDLIVDILPADDPYEPDGLKLSLANGEDSLTIYTVGEGATFSFAGNQNLTLFDIAQLGINRFINESSIAEIVPWSSEYIEPQTFVIAPFVGMGAKEISATPGRFSFRIELDSSYDPGDLSYHPLSEGKLRIDFGSGGDSITVPDFRETLGSPASYVHSVQIRFSDNTTLGNADFIDLVTDSGAFDGTSSADTLSGGSGDDLLIGNGGADVYLFGYGSGHDQIEGSGTVEFASGIAPADVEVTVDESGRFITLTLISSSETITFGDVKTFSDISVHFAGGTEWTVNDLVTKIADKFDRSNAETIVLPNVGMGVELHPGGGNDTVQAIGSAYISFGRGDGHDTVLERADIRLTDVYSLDELDIKWEALPGEPDVNGITPIDLYGLGNRRVTLTISDTGDSISFTEQGKVDVWNNPGYEFSTITLANDESYSFNDINQYLIDKSATNLNDTLEGAPWTSLEFDGKGGDDVLNGRLGDSVYIFGRGYGTDTIIENSVGYNLSGTDPSFDVVRFDDSVNPSDIEASINPAGELVLKITGTDDKLVIPCLQNNTFRPGIEQFEFADSTIWMTGDLLDTLLQATSGDDVIFEKPDSSSYGVQAQADILDGGAGNDFLAGGGGADIYSFGLGYGSDTIFDRSNLPNGWASSGDSESYGWFPDPENDILTFGAGIDLEDLIFVRGGVTGNDLIIKIQGTDDQVIIVDQFAPMSLTAQKILLGGYAEFPIPDSNGNGQADPEEMDYVIARLMASSPNGIETFGFSSQQELSIDDIEVRISGIDNSGDNQYVTSDLGGTLDGGTGSDTLSGGTANDDYVFARGYGEDCITDGGGYDIVKFGIGIRQMYVHFSRAGENDDDLFIEVDGPERLTLTVTDQFATVPGTIEEFDFLTGQSYTWQDVQAIILDEDRTTGNDSIKGFLTDDVLDGGDGNDTLIGRGGNDTLIGGAGRDMAVFSGAAEDYTVSDEVDHVIVTDLRADGDGVDYLYGIEDLKFLGDNDQSHLVPENHAPTADDVELEGTEDTDTVIARAALLANAGDVDATSPELLKLQNAQSGQVWINLDGDIVFRPTANFFGEASFEYVVVDPDGATATGTVTLTIDGVNDTPVVSNIGLEVNAGVGAEAVLTASDIDGDALTFSIEEQATKGTLTVNPDTGALSFGPSLDEEGSDSAVVRVTDVHGAYALLNVAIEISPAELWLYGDEIVEGTAGGTEIGAVIASPQIDGVTAITFALTDDDGGRFEIDEDTGILSLASGASVDFESADSHSVTVEISNGTDAYEQALLISVVNAAPGEISDADATDNSVADGAINGTIVGLTATATDPAGGTVSYSLTDDAGGRFAINSSTGVVTVANSTLLDHTTSTEHEIEISASDGDLSTVQSFTITVTEYVPSVITGTTGNDTLTGTAGIDTIYALAGNDIVTAGSGNDTIVGADGDDTLSGEGGDDTFLFTGAASGFDDIDGGSGFDIILADADDTALTINSLTNVEQISAGGHSGVYISGSAAGQSFNFTFTGLTLTGIDRIEGNGGNDYIAGSNGADTLVGGAGDDTLFGVDGDNTFLFSGTNEGYDVIGGGAGTDTISALADNTVIGLHYVDQVEAVSAGSYTGVYVSGSAGADSLYLSGTTLTGITKIDGGSGADTIVGSISADTILGGLGNDYLSGGGGDDNIDGGSGDDLVTYSYATAAWTIDLSAAFAQATSGSETDTISNVENVIGGSGNDTITGDANNNTFQSGYGDDSVSGGDGDDTFRFNTIEDGGFDVIDGGAGTDVITAWGPSAIIGLRGISNVETITAGAYSDISISGSSSADSLDFSSVTLTNITKIDGGSGNDTIIGSAAADTIVGGLGNDALQGGAGGDRYVFNLGDGQDVITESAAATGNDELSFGSDVDASDLDFGLDANGDVIISITGSSDSITLAGAGSSSTIEQIRFSDDTIWDAAEIASHLGPNVINGTPAADTLVGSAGQDIISGLAADDLISGNDGDDTLVGGDGSDTINGGAGDDKFLFGVSLIGYDDIDGGSGTDMLVADADNAAMTLRTLTSVEQITADGHSGVKITGGSGGRALSFSGVTLTDITRIEAGTGNDTITGSAGGDVIWGSDGLDSLSGAAGNDSISGDADADVISGGTGNDTLVGGAGNDSLSGDDDNDFLTGSAGDDTILGGAGDDSINVSGTSDGADSVDGGSGTDTILAGTNNTTITLKALAGIEAVTANGFTSVSIAGTSNADTLDFSTVTLTSITKIDAGGGNDTITGSGAADTILGSAGDDNLSGSGGNDSFQFSGTSDGFDAVDGGSGTDTLSALANNTVIGLTSVTGVEAITANGFTGVYVGGSSNADALDLSSVTLTSITKIDGGAGNDSLTGSAAADTIVGGSGNDLLSGRAGNDSIDGGADSDTVDYSYASAAWTINLSAGSSQGTSGSETDTITNVENVIGGTGNDTITGTSAVNVLNGGDGNDSITSGDGDDSVSGGDGNDVFRVSGSTSGHDYVDGGAGSDTITATANSTWITLRSVANVETITSGGYTGVYIGGSDDGNEALDFTSVTLSGITAIDGGGGNDSIIGSSTANTIWGSEGNDTLDGGSGNDSLTGGEGDDSILGGDGNDVILDAGYSGGYDNVDGGSGSDTITAYSNNTTIGLRSVANVETITSGGYSTVYIGGTDDNGESWDFTSVALSGITAIDGGGGNDSIIGSSTANTIWGSEGNDTLSGGGGNDSLSGGTGADILIGGSGNDNMNGQDDTDTVDYSYASAAWTINLSAGSSQGTSGSETDTITNVENVIGGTGNDSITGTSSANVLAGNDGADTISGSGGNDTLQGGAGDDRLTGGTGNDSIDGGTGTGDVAVFAGLQATYSITTSSGTVTIVDNNTSQDGNDGTDTLVGVETAEFKGAVQVSLGSPIVLDLDGDGVELIDRKKSKATFDWNGDGDRDKTGWVGKDDGLLVFDRNHDGSINAANELSFVDDKPGAKSDLDGLSAFDSNEDGLFSADDEAFASFNVWRDRNGDGKSQRSELMTLADAGIGSITLAGTAVNRSWGWNDNLTINTGSFNGTDGSVHAFSDVALNYTENGGGRARYSPSVAANQFAEAIAAFRPKGGDEVTLGKHDMELSKTPVFAGERDRYI